MTLLYEVIHYFGFVFLLALNIIVIIQGKMGWTVAILLMNIFIKFFAIILSRYNRIRIIRIFDLQKDELNLSNNNNTADVKK